MGYRNLLIVGCQAGREGGCGVAVHQDYIRFVGGENAFHALQDGGGDVGQVLTGLHDIQVEIRLNTKQTQHLVQHFSMLSGHANLGVEGFISG
ncbi:hypothetical protein D3C76_610030 [compost metagenome]